MATTHVGEELQFERDYQVAVDSLVHNFKAESFGGFSALYCRQCDKTISSFGFTTHGKRCESCNYKFHRGCALRRICPHKLLYDTSDFIEKYKVAAICDGLLDPRMFENAPLYGNTTSLVFDEPREHTFNPYSASLTANTACTVCGKKLQTGLKCGVCKYHVHKDCSEKAIKACRSPVASIGELQKSIDASSVRAHGYDPPKEPRSAGFLPTDSSSNIKSFETNVHVSRSQGSTPITTSPPSSPPTIRRPGVPTPDDGPAAVMSPRLMPTNRETVFARVASKDSRSSRVPDRSVLPLDELYDVCKEIPPTSGMISAICTLEEKNEWEPELRILALELGESVRLRIDAVVAILVKCRGDISASLQAILEDRNLAVDTPPRALLSNSPALMRQWAPELRQLQEMGFAGEPDYQIALLIEHNGDISRVASMLANN